jgi:hypothetical protein
MKRVLAISVLAVALILPATAGSATSTITRSYSGGFQEGGTVNFTATVKTIKRKHHKKKVKVIRVNAAQQGARQLEHVPITCDEGTYTFNFGWFTNYRVKKNEFTVRGTASLTHVFSGKFTKKGKKVAGTYRASGDFDASHTNCDTGKLHWSA